ncbi:MAG: cysteine desulfurase [Erysipelotrichaceae bacterium]|nr:cysteine desulfurase [Erysipelotrichaceae bacterium]
MFEVSKIRRDFPMLWDESGRERQLVYFDNSATSFKPQQVIDAEMAYYTRFSANIHRGDYALSYEADQAYDHARAAMARFINAREEEVIFTSGTTQGLNMAAYGLKGMLREGDVILSTLAEHASNILPWFRLAEQTGARVEFIPLDESGRLTVDNFRKALHERVRIVAVAQVTNVLGYLADMKSICALAHQVGAIVVVDGAQSVPHKQVDVKDMDCDLLAFSGHKMCGPTGIGVLYGKSELLERMEPMMLGGGANKRFNSHGDLILSKVPDRFEAGTVPIGQAVGLAEAAEYLQKIGLPEIERREKQLHDYLSGKLRELDNIEFYNPDSDSAICSFNVRGIFAQDAASYLSSRNIAVRSGNHCAKMLVGFLGTDATIRASMYFYNTEEEADRLVQALRNCTLENCIDIFL